ncbi:MAG: glutaminyl-peptide cyclotransferase [Chloroflexota bacterium]
MAIATPSAPRDAAPAPAAASPAASSVAAAPTLAWEVVGRIPHASDAFLQGLAFDPDGRLWASTGLYGRSSVRELDPATGAVLRSAALPVTAFGEGIALGAAGELVQLTWQEGTAFRWERTTLRPLPPFTYTGEGWGLCADGERLVMSDGSDRLTFRDPATFAVTGSVAVTRDGLPVRLLNELECADGAVWANVWQTETIVRIDPSTGVVTGVLDLDGLLEPDPAAADPVAVLNGIARIPGRDTWLVGGKLWPALLEIRIDG